MGETLVQKASQLTLDAQIKRQAKRQAAAAELQDLLVRNESPRPGDEKRLVELLDQFNVSADQLPELQELATKLQEYADAEVRSGEIMGEYGEADRAVLAVEDWYKAELVRLEHEKEQRLDTARAKRAKVAKPHHTLKEARQYGNNRKAEWWAILNGTDLETELRAMREGSVRSAL